ncbi:MAG: hypothetical protein LBF33_03900 [Oscillospiraceae bacterium]|jgi:methylglyoxal synthase|nr:hypothetical protein [Oscillospiraceae bacterium]
MIDFPINLVLLSDIYRLNIFRRFCLTYKDIFEKCKIFTVCPVEREIRRAINLEAIALFSLEDGGITQLRARVYYNEVDLLFFFRGIVDNEICCKQENKLFTTCDINNVPYATNIATAEILMSAFLKGKLDENIKVRHKRREVV